MLESTRTLTPRRTYFLSLRRVDGNAVISKRFAKGQQMQSTPRGAHLLNAASDARPRSHAPPMFER